MRLGLLLYYQTWKDDIPRQCTVIEVESIGQRKKIKKKFADQSIGVAASEVNGDILRQLHIVVFPVTNNAVVFGSSKPFSALQLS